MLVILIVIGILVLDMVTKILLDGKVIPLIDGVVSFVSEYNTGGAWGIFGEYTWLLALFSIIFVIGFIFVDRKMKISHPLYKISFALIIAGTIGNMIDRLALGYVRDFIYLDFLKTFPIFNVADMSLVIGMCLLAVYILFIYKSDNKGVKNE